MKTQCVFRQFIGVLAITAILLILAIHPGCRNKSADKRNPFGLDLVMDAETYRIDVAADQANRMMDLLEVVPGIQLDIRYATPHNFTGEVIYTSAEAWLRQPVAEALKRVSDSLSVLGIGLKVYDAYRPYSASLRFWEVYPDSNFVALPSSGSRHNRGCSVDLSLYEISTGKELPMPTGFDEFSPKAHPEYMDLPDTVIHNRKLLFDVMAHFGFIHHDQEWWHFDYQGWGKYKLMDLSFGELRSSKHLN